MGQDIDRLEPKFAEFIFRVYPDGRRERTARILVREPDGSVAPVTAKLEGSVGRFAAEAVREVVELDKRSEQRRPVAIDPRADPSRRHRR